MEVVALIAIAIFAAWGYCKIAALQERCTYLEHLVGDLLTRPAVERLEGDEWKDGVSDE